MIIDGHCHVWPDAIASRALAGSVEGQRFGDGRTQSLLQTMKAAGIDRSVCLGVANEPNRVEAANRFAGSLDRRHFIGFGSIHPGLPVETNISSLRRHRLSGAKVHPYFQNYRLDDKRLWEIFDAMQGEFTVIAHVGAAGEHDGSFCTPAMVRRIAEAFPKLDFIACHLGGYLMLDDAEIDVIARANVYLDTSWPPGIASVDPDRVRSVIQRHGPERVVFASDWPMADPQSERETIEAIGLDADALKLVLGGNLSRILHLEA